jgi:hypothetical protein
MPYRAAGTTRIGVSACRTTAKLSLPRKSSAVKPRPWLPSTPNEAGGRACAMIDFGQAIHELDLGPGSAILDQLGLQSFQPIPIRTIELLPPILEIRCVPKDNAPRCPSRPSAHFHSSHLFSF